ncbi:MAG: transporter [Rhizobacter sp.]|nr:transporter [Rhizobacter sp.]
MQSIFAVTAPFFALVLLGYLGARQRLVPEAAIAGLNAFVLFFALPCMLYRFGAGTPFAQLLDVGLLVVYGAVAMVMVALTVFLTWKRRPQDEGVGLTDAAFGALVAAFPNTGFMGVPLIVALLGSTAAGPMMVTLLIDLILTSSVCLAITQMQGAKNGAVTASLLRSLRGALRNPLPWAIALGAVASAVGLRLPAPVDQVMKMLGDAATPVALFAIGAVLWRAGQHVHNRTPVRRYLPIALIKLVLHPMLVFGAGRAAMAAGLPIPTFGLSVLTLAAALPSASNVSLLAERFGADNGRIARIIMASTILAFGSFSGLAWWISHHALP